MADLAAQRKARLEQSGGQRLEFIARRANVPQPVSDVATSAGSSSASPPRRSAFSGSPVFSSSPPAGFARISKRATTTAAAEPAVAQTATGGGASISGPAPAAMPSALTPGPPVAAKRAAPVPLFRRNVPVVLTAVLAAGTVLLSLRIPLLLLSVLLVSGYLLATWLLEPTTQETLRSLKGTFQSTTTPRMEKLGLGAVLMLQQLGPLREMARSGTDALCVAVVVAVLLKSLVG